MAIGKLRHSNRTTSYAWLSIPLDDYEGHMNAAEVGQLPVLADLFHYVLERWCPESVIVLGVAGGNGLDGVNTSVTKRIVGVDINPQYLDVVGQRFDKLPGLELARCDLSLRPPLVAPAALVHAALLFEHAGLRTTLDNALSLVALEGLLSVVLQLPSIEAQHVAATKYASMQNLKEDFALVDAAEFHLQMSSRGFELLHQIERPLPAGRHSGLAYLKTAASILENTGVMCNIRVEAKPGEQAIRKSHSNIPDQTIPTRDDQSADARQFFRIEPYICPSVEPVVILTLLSTSVRIARAVVPSSFHTTAKQDASKKPAAPRMNTFG